MFDNVAQHQGTSHLGSPTLPARHSVLPLPPSVREHLGQMLRSDYYERAEKPRYTGDPALPLEFDPYLYRLEQKERALRIMRVREQGTQAVADALSGLNL